MAVAILALGALLVQPASPARATTAAPQLSVEEITTRGGAVQKVLLLVPEAPRAVALVLPREHRTLHLARDGAVEGEAAAGFLARSRRLLAARGFAVALPTATTYPRTASLLDDELHVHGDPLADLAALAARLRQRLGVPVWLLAEHDSAATGVGAVLAAGDARPFEGLVIVGGQLGGDGKNGGVGTLNLTQISGPTLLVHHKEDDCPGASYSQAQGVFDALEQASPKDLIGVAGGRNRDGARTPPCNAFARHGFSGIEALVVDGIADWIKLLP